MHPIQHQPGKNYLLEMLPPSDRARVLRSMAEVTASRHDYVYRRLIPLEFVDFPLSGVISVVRIMNDGHTAEIANIGNEGMSGLSGVFHADSEAYDAFYQVAGRALRMPIVDFCAELDRRGTFASVLQRYAQTLYVQVAQTAACNRLHDVERRFARWILMAHDRVEDATVQLTQEFLAMMLGVRRASVTTAALNLQKAGMITYHRGRIEVLNRDGLESAACECYRFVRDEYQRLLPMPTAFTVVPASSSERN